MATAQWQRNSGNDRAAWPLINAYRPIPRRPVRSDRSIACDCYPEAGAGVRPVIPHRAVLHAPVIPERHRVLLPAEAALEQRVLGMIIQIGQDRRTLVPRHAKDTL